MTDTVEQLEALLRGTPWDGVPVRETGFSGFRERAFCLQLASPCDDNEWHLLSQLTRRVGLYPVLSRADHVEPGFQVYPPEWEDGSVDSLDEACAQAGRVNGLNFLSTGGALRGPFSPTQTHHMAGWLDMPSGHWAHPLNQMRRRFGDSPAIEELRKLHVTGVLKTDVDFERWLLDWELQRFGAAALVPESLAHLDGGELNGESPCVALLVPTLDSCRVLLGLGWWGLEADAAEKAAALRVWEERYGAQLTRCFATTLHLRVARRPADIDEAFALAIEHRHFASDTFVLPGISLREHARALLSVDRWYFHDRP